MRLLKYDSRLQAGELLADFIIEKNREIYKQILKNKKEFFSYAIPNGGVAVTEGFSSRFNLDYDILIVRKIKIPHNTEAGFGSITTDGTILVNQPLLSQLNLSEKSIKDSIEITKTEIKSRLKFYSKKNNLKDSYEEHIKNKNIFILDDGLASGFTMLAAISMIKKYNPEKIYIAVPTAPLRTVNLIKPEVDKVLCPNVREVAWFAVADAYKNWYDVPESEVLDIINNSTHYTKASLKS
ncbi:MAG: phosphoribosyltransferase [Promethearchaeota archaeon]|jgi:predicted phosphoribosyltransferase